MEFEKQSAHYNLSPVKVSSIRGMPCESMEAGKLLEGSKTPVENSQDLSVMDEFTKLYEQLTLLQYDITLSREQRIAAEASVQHEIARTQTAEEEVALLREDVKPLGLALGAQVCF